MSETPTESLDAEVEYCRILINAEQHIHAKWSSELWFDAYVGQITWRRSSARVAVSN
jgi:hypothetical protein